MPNLTGHSCKHRGTLREMRRENVFSWGKQGTGTGVWANLGEVILLVLSFVLSCFVDGDFLDGVLVRLDAS